MAATGKFKVSSARFGATNEEELNKILEERNAPSTNKSTKNSMGVLHSYLKEKNLMPLDQVPNSDLPDLLQKFYTDARTKSGELYHVQTMKSL